MLLQLFILKITMFMMMVIVIITVIVVICSCFHCGIPADNDVDVVDIEIYAVDVPLLSDVLVFATVDFFVLYVWVEIKTLLLSFA